MRKAFPMKPFEVMLRTFARSRLLKEEEEFMKDAPGVIGY